MLLCDCMFCDTIQIYNLRCTIIIWGDGRKGEGKQRRKEGERVHEEGGRQRGRGVGTSHEMR